MPAIGLALGGGGAKGLAHTVVLEALGELGLRPAVVAGTSMGAVMAAACAAEIPAPEVRKLVEEMAATQAGKMARSLFKRDATSLLDLIDPNWGRGGLIKGGRFLEFLGPLLGAEDFAELGCPLLVVAADFWEQEQVVLSSGPLLPALRASVALPGLLSPVELQGKVLIDGGAVNPVPFDLLLKDCDLTIAVDVMGKREKRTGKLPGPLGTFLNTIQIMQRTVLEEKLARQRPQVMVRIDLGGLRLLDFHRGREVLKRAAPAKEKLKRRLDELL